ARYSREFAFWYKASSSYYVSTFQLPAQAVPTLIAELERKIPEFERIDMLRGFVPRMRTELDDLRRLNVEISRQRENSTLSDRDSVSVELIRKDKQFNTYTGDAA